MKKIYFILFIFLFSSICESSESVQNNDEGKARSKELGIDPVPKSKFLWIPGVEYNTLQELSLPQHFFYCIWCAMAPHGYGGGHILLEISPGYNAHSISVGGTLFGGLALSAVSSKLTYLKSYKNKWQLQNYDEYVGPEFSLNLVFVDIEIGIMKKLTKKSDSKNTIVSFGLGVSL